MPTGNGRVNTTPEIQENSMSTVSTQIFSPLETGTPWLIMSKKEGDYCGNLEADGHVGRYADLWKQLVRRILDLGHCKVPKRLRLGA